MFYGFRMALENNSCLGTIIGLKSIPGMHNANVDRGANSRIIGKQEVIRAFNR
jgi:hypothetical protein